MQVKLDGVVDALTMMDAETYYYYKIKTQEIIFLNDLVNDTSDFEKIDKNEDDYISLPSSYDINDYQLMVDFIEQLSDEQQQRQLEDAIQGRGAFRLFRELTDQFGITDQWYKLLVNGVLKTKLRLKLAEDNANDRTRCSN